LNFSLINSLILVGIIQGFIFGIVYLSSNKYRNKVTLFLTLLIISFSYNNLQFYLQNTEILSGLKMYRTIYLPVGTVMPVFVYFYTLELTVGLRNKFKNSWIFYVPFIVFSINAIAFKIYDASFELTRAGYNYFKWSQTFQNIFSFIYNLILIGASYRISSRYINRLKAKKNQSFQQYNWVIKTLLLLFLLTLFWGASLFIYIINNDATIWFNLLWIGLSITIYYFGHIGIYKYGVVEERKKNRAVSSSLKIRSNNEKLVGVLQQKLIEEQQFLNSALTLELLAETIKVSPSHLSRFFNTELDSNFSDYVNQLRVKQAQLYLSDPTFSKYTIIAIGLEAGFNSKTTFNTAFKKFTGITPSQYRKRMLS